MPNPKTYSKGILNLNAVPAGNVIPQVNISFQIKDNFNDTTLTYDSITEYSYYLPISITSLSLTTDLDSGIGRLFEINCGDIQLSFAYGEYYDIANSQPLNIADVYSLVSVITQA